MAAVAGLALAMTTTVTALADAPDRQTGPVRVTLKPLSGVVVTPNRYWYIRGEFRFTVKATDVGTEDDQNLFVFVSIPDEIRMTTFSGNRWRCESVVGGLDCSNPDLVVPGESWPALTITTRGTGYVQDTLDVYAIANGDDWAHVGVPFVYDTSS
ncbi:hypothetical protein CLV43_105535 [Umezawaea tangerina]|uniref:Uncharacterized protein n=2 Tax=Umezawaea tangerina TaxID=84725 RepID=A0A2T0T7Z8_9PSEU|nr:hypothetical protein CLV43_105535 [Umezawaea tangerina]